MIRRVFLATALLLLPALAAAQDAAIKQLIESPAFKTATAFIEKDQPRFVKELIELTEIPAPPFKEERRAKRYLEMLREAGLSDVATLLSAA